MTKLLTNPQHLSMLEEAEIDRKENLSKSAFSKESWERFFESQLGLFTANAEKDLPDKLR